MTVPNTPEVSVSKHHLPRWRRKPVAKALTRRPLPPRRAPEAHKQVYNEMQAFLVALLAFLIIARLAAGAAAPIAMPGDRIVYGHQSWAAPPLIVQAREVAGPWAKPGTACRLDVPAMARRPGALTVLAVRPDGVMLDWAGGAAAPADCRDGTTLLVSDVDYTRLQHAQQPKR